MNSSVKNLVILVLLGIFGFGGWYLSKPGFDLDLNQPLKNGFTLVMATALFGVTAIVITNTLAVPVAKTSLLKDIVGYTFWNSIEELLRYFGAVGILAVVDINKLLALLIVSFFWMRAHGYLIENRPPASSFVFVLATIFVGIACSVCILQYGIAYAMVLHVAIDTAAAVILYLKK